MTHAFYINTSYIVTFGLIFGAIAWIWLDGRARQKELKALEASGVRRRSAPKTSEMQS